MKAKNLLWVIVAGLFFLAVVAEPKVFYVSYCDMKLEVNLKNNTVLPHDQKTQDYFDIEKVVFRTH